jgi:hypothetical protein
MNPDRASSGATSLARRSSAGHVLSKPARSLPAHHAAMATRSSALDLASADARQLRQLIAGEIRIARRNAGLSQRVAGGASGMSHAQFGRIERGELPELTILQASRAARAVGLRLAARLYPAGDAVRDAGQLALIGRFRAILPPSVLFRTEVPLPIAGDPRAWDGLGTFADGLLGVEAEARLGDVQAMDRRIGLKQRDGGIDRVVLLIADTQANRQALAAHREALRSRFPLDGRAVMRALRAGRRPDASGILVL